MAIYELTFHSSSIVIETDEHGSGQILQSDLPDGTITVSQRASNVFYWLWPVPGLTYRKKSLLPLLKR